MSTIITHQLSFGEECVCVSDVFRDQQALLNESSVDGLS